MDVLIFLILSSFVLVNTKAFDVNDCPSVNCGHGSPVIQFPFRARETQLQHCGLPGFELSCKQNKTIIHFPAYGDLVVKSISYDKKRINLLDPENCVHEVFLNLNLSSTPFKYYYVLKQYRYLNCSAKLSAPFIEIPCLSGASHHVYTVESFSAITSSCIPLKSIGIPFAYSPYLSDNTFGLGLTWDLTACKDNEAMGCLSNTKSGTGNEKGMFDKSYYKVLGFSILIFMVVALVSLKTSHPESYDEKKEDEKQKGMQIERLLGDYETLEPAGRSSANDINVLIEQIQTAAGDDKKENAFSNLN